MSKIRIAICGDCETASLRIKNICEGTDNLTCIFVAKTDKEILTMAKKHKPNILLLITGNGNTNSGILPELSDVCPKMKVIMFTEELEDSVVYSSFAMGACDFITNSMTDEEILNIICGVANGENTMRPEIAKILATNSVKMRSSLLYLINILVRLSPSEFEVLKNVYDGMSYTEIAKDRYVSVSTIKNQVLRVLKKFKVHSMKDLVEELRELRIFDLIPDQQFKKNNK